MIADLPHVQFPPVKSMAQQFGNDSTSCIDDLKLNEQGLLTDQMGRPIIMGAGRNTGEKTDMEPRAELRSFCLYGHLDTRSSAFADTGEDLEEMLTAEEDASLPYMAAELAAMGQ